MTSQTFAGKLWRISRPCIYWSPSVFFIGYNFYYVNQISGRSMQPTLNPDTCSRRDVGLFDLAAVKYGQNYKRGDIVGLTSPKNPERTLVKRIIAVGGDTVQTLAPYPDKEVVVPQNQVWVEGDEHFISEDSNHLGPIPAGLLHGKLIAIIWPPERFGWIKSASEIAEQDPSIKSSALMTELRKERWRQSRVKVPEPESDQSL